MEKQTKNTNKRNRGNGQGSILIHKNRTKPYEVQVTIGYEINEETGKSKRISKSLGYYKTKTEAQQVLTSYLANNLENERKGNVSRFVENITFAQLYEKWSEEKYKKKISRSTVLGYTAAFKAVPKLHNRVFITLQTADLVDALYSSGKNYPTMRKIRLLFSQLYDFARMNRLTDFDASSFIRFDSHEKEELNPNRIDRNCLTVESIKIIFEDNSEENSFSDTIKFLLYTGVRVSEMMNLKRNDVFLNDNFFIVRESKTEAGRNRPVPIHKDLKPIIEKWLNNPSEKTDTLFYGAQGKKFIDSVYRRNYWDKYFEANNLPYHRPHDCRHTFKTFATACRLRENWVERILGHKNEIQMTKRYDRPYIQMLCNEINNLEFTEETGKYSLIDYNTF